MQVLLKLIIFTTLVAAVRTTCDVCQGRNHVACHSRTRYSLCINGRATEDYITCPENTICTSDVLVCYPQESAVATCERSDIIHNPSIGNNLCGVCDGNKVFACLNETTIAFCFGADMPEQGSLSYCPEQTVCDISRESGFCTDSALVKPSCSQSQTDIPGNDDTSSMPPAPAEPRDPNEICEEVGATGQYKTDDDTTCTKFITCYVLDDTLHGVEESCPTGEYFHPENGLCAADKPEDCPAPTVTTDTTPTTVDSTNSTPTPGESINTASTTVDSTNSTPTPGDSTNSTPTPGDFTNTASTPGDSTNTTPTTVDSTNSTPTPGDSTNSTPTPGDSTNSTPTTVDSTDTTSTPGDSTNTTPTTVDSTNSTPTPGDSTNSTPTPGDSTNSTPTTVDSTDTTSTPGDSTNTTPTTVDSTNSTPTPGDSTNSTPTTVDSTDTTPTPGDSTNTTPTPGDSTNTTPTTSTETVPQDPRDPTKICLDEGSTGSYKTDDDDTCTKFVICYILDGTLHGLAKTCPAGQYFHPEKRMCESSKPESCLNEDDTTTTTAATEPTKTTPSETEGARDPNEICQDAGSTGSYKTDDDVTCTKFVICYMLDGTLQGLAKTCPVGQYFHPEKRMCESSKPESCWTEDDTTKTTAATEPTKTTPSETEGARDPNEICQDAGSTGSYKTDDDVTCTKFVVCYFLSGTLQGLQKTCPPGQYFHSEKGLCGTDKPEGC